VNPVLELDNVSASYSTYRALFGVSFSVPDNGLVALVGSNGAGKSTVARTVSGLVPVSSGSVRVAGEDVTRRSAHRIAALGVTHVPEGRAIFSSLTVEENLTVAFRKRVDRKGVADALRRAYDAFPILAERRKQFGGTLSGGQQRILSLAKVLAVPPRLLIADELSLGLAPVIVDQVYDGLAAIHRQGSALLVVEQQVDRVLAIADRAVLLVKGAVAWDGPASEARPALEARMLGGRAEDHAPASSLLAASPARSAARTAPVPGGAAPSGPEVGAVTTTAPPPPPAPPVTPGARPPAPPPATPPPPAPWAPPPAPAPRRHPPETGETEGGDPPGLWV
jgi:branched-chain amino acid transport system ATP-binding protein